MKIPAAYVERIQRLGYTESEARFLYIVALFSGYFTMAQFRAFTGSRCGKRPTCFAQKLVGQGHARVCAQARTAALFHLFSRKVYGQMDNDNLRNRKRHSFEFMRTPLILLDFILANQEFTYFETERDKVNLFCNELGISKDYLPAKVYEGATPDEQTTRYFVDKFPLFLAPPLPGVPAVVTSVTSIPASRGRRALPRILLPTDPCSSSSTTFGSYISWRKKLTFTASKSAFGP